jgi:gluconate 2-dehydrogenase gamma chain
MAQTPNDAAFSRRELLRRAGFLGAATAFVPLTLLRAQVGAPLRTTPITLTAVEAETLDAVVARLIPGDAASPGAIEARAGQYIDRALGGFLASSRDAYRSGLAALDAHALSTKGGRFVRLGAADQDAVLSELEANVATGFTPDAATFFNLVRAHTIQGTFCDPFYGGNASFVGWDLIGYPGVRLAVSVGEQRLDPRLQPTHRSAYDHAMFARKRPADGH